MWATSGWWNSQNSGQFSFECRYLSTSHMFLWSRRWCKRIIRTVKWTLWRQNNTNIRAASFIPTTPAEAGNAAEWAAYVKNLNIDIQLSVTCLFQLQWNHLDHWAAKLQRVLSELGRRITTQLLTWKKPVIYVKDLFYITENQCDMYI